MADLTTASEAADRIRDELATAQAALDRYYDLTAIQYRAQEVRLRELEQQVHRLENELSLIRGSRIWRTLVGGSRLIVRLTGRIVS